MVPRTRWTAATAAAVTGTLLTIGLATPAQAERSAPRPEPPGEHVEPPDKDARGGALAPTARQKSAARDVTVRWNRFGTPASVTGTGALADGLPGGPEKAARAYLAGNRDLFGLDAPAVTALEKVAVNPIGDGAAVLLRQRFGDLPAGHDGLVAVGVRGDEVVSVTSSLSRDGGAPPSATLSEEDAVAAAARDAGITVSDGATRRVRLVAVPTADGVRSAYQVTLMDTSAAEPKAVTSHVDARSGAVLVRENLVDHDSDDPRWSVFPATPPGDYSSRDTRRTWCYTPARGCSFVVGGDPSNGNAWDVDPATGESTHTSLGNAARSYDNRASDDPFTVGTRTNAPRPDRAYTYRWGNQWYKSKCDPATLDSPQEADLEAAISNLFVQHNRMHDWSYRLGFTESAWNMQADNGDRGGLGGDPEQGNAQAGARFPSIRDNANQITFPDGIAPITNMYLWQPIAGAFYSPCVDGDFDMTVIGHEYSHAISGRMVAGPDAGWSGPQAGAMNESTSDLLAMEYLSEYGFRPPGRTPYVIGAYVTGEPRAGIRNYDMSRSPLNYGDIGYDLVGTQVHADGEIWTATQFDLREAFVRRYGDGSAALQRKCADGKVDAAECPGNRRWAQLSMDALLLMASGAVSYVDHRDALLAADTIRFGGKNHELMWKVFARHGLGEAASSAGPADADPVPSFASPMSRNAGVTLKPRGDAKDGAVRLYVGDYEARAVPVADTDPATPLGATFAIAPGRYSFVAVGAGFGHKKFTATIGAGQKSLPVTMHRNLAASANGATAAGDGQSQGALLDETEATNWQSVEAPVADRQVTVDLAGDRPVKVGRIQVSAMLRPTVASDPEGANTAQNRFTALRAFKVLACDSTRADCAADGSYRTVYTSPSDAFPADRPRPTAPDINLRSFDLRDVKATHLRLQVVSSQCTGAPAYAGEQDNDPRSATDCGTAARWAGLVRAAELQAFAR
ncbi:M36 family metallopeptidase [Actinomadura sp. 7K534]|uniref:M36 family metallopeptidase n=1 Tax=Actinomadura sp. 7K534 TaxID=2530366 RepID=UPI00104AFF93|nr:M36 family metallopeptidase [Actinomadura sp. 7K534]TDB94420.1 peptidase M36 [Actinomadura sp. 7K534]